MNYLSTIRQFDRNVRLYLVTLATIGIGFIGLFSLLINLYLLRLGYGIEFIGIFGAAGVLTLALFAVPAGIIGGRLGSRRALILGMVFISVGLALVLQSELMPPSIRAAWLVSTYVLSWIGGALMIVNGSPFMMANTASQERNHAFAVSNAVLPLAAFVGAIIGGLLPGLLAALLHVPLDDPTPYRIAMWLSVPCYLVGLLALMLTDGRTQERSAREAGPTGTTSAGASTKRFPYALIGVMMLILFFRLAADTAARSYFSVYMDTSLHAPTSLIGLVSAAAQLLAVPAALAAPLMIGRLGLGRTFMFAVLALSASVLPLALIPAVPAAAAGLLGVTVAATLSMTSVTLFHQQIVRPEWRTAMSGGVTMASGIGQALIIFAGGFLIAAWGFSRFFLSTGALTLVAAVLFWAYFRSSRRAAAPLEVAAGAAVAEVVPETKALAVP
jgi:MFS family permease